MFLPSHILGTDTLIIVRGILESMRERFIFFLCQYKIHLEQKSYLRNKN